VAVTGRSGRGSSHRVGLIIAAVVLVVCGVPAAGCAGVLYRLGFFGPDVQPMLDELRIVAPGIQHMTPDGLSVVPEWRRGRREMNALVSGDEFQAIIEREFVAKGWEPGRCYGENAHLADSCWERDGVTAELLMGGFVPPSTCNCPDSPASEAIINGEAR
jgi:hypothetical protein